MALYIANSQIDDLGQNAIAFGKGRPVVDLGPRLNPFLNESAACQIEALNFSKTCHLHGPLGQSTGRLNPAGHARGPISQGG